MDSGILEEGIGSSLGTVGTRELTVKREKSSTGDIESLRGKGKIKGLGRDKQITHYQQVERLLDPQRSLVSLATLAHTIALSGRRLVLEIRDQNPVKIIAMERKHGRR